MSLLERITRDTRRLGDLARVLSAARRVRPTSTATVADFIDESAARAPGHTALLFEDRVVTWSDLDAAANRVAHWAREQGIGRGSVVALLMENRPEYVETWLGLARIGATTALLNTNLTGERLAHCLREADAEHWIVGSERASACRSALPHLSRRPQLWRSGRADDDLSDAGDLNAALETASAAPVGPEARAGMQASDLLFYIYTSGTTGLPKAARFTHYRFALTAFGAIAAQRLTPDDRVYVALPLYHTAGGVMALGGALFAGATAVIARRFSTSRFWSDCVRYEVTTFQYIGELCRYLLHAPPHPDERRHHVRVCVGNGLRPEVWEPFQKRFGIERILELYGATEGNMALMNLDGHVGAVGRVPAVVRRAMGLEILRFDVEREEVVRDAEGHCVRCDTGEPGELVTRISSLSRFDGYSDPEATEKKILRDVFQEGDAYFRSGDLMRVDARGYFYFVDRIGDTFRWKGENVSTNEVSEVVSVAPGVVEANVYGVSIPGTDGRAGMAALVVNDRFELAELQRCVESELAPYARPLFLRLLPEMEVTGTFKHRKVDLVKQGFDPKTVSDPLFFHDPGEGYVPLDATLFEEIRAGERRL